MLLCACVSEVIEMHLLHKLEIEAAFNRGVLYFLREEVFGDVLGVTAVLDFRLDWRRVISILDSLPIDSLKERMAHYSLSAACGRRPKPLRWVFLQKMVKKVLKF